MPRSSAAKKRYMRALDALRPSSFPCEMPEDVMRVQEALTILLNRDIHVRFIATVGREAVIIEDLGSGLVIGTTPFPSQGAPLPSRWGLVASIARQHVPLYDDT